MDDLSNRPSMLTRVEKQPSSPVRVATENAGESGAALHAGVVLLDARARHLTAAAKFQRSVRFDVSRLSMEICAGCARLDPSFHARHRSTRRAAQRIIETTRKQWGAQ